MTPYVWTPKMYWEAGYGTFAQTNNPLSYEAFCCGMTLMQDGKIAIAGSNFDDHLPGRQVSTYNPVTNTWFESQDPYLLNKARYYPTCTRMPSGKIVVTGGQAVEDDPDTEENETEFVAEPFEVNPSVSDLQASWLMPVLTDYDLLNYPYIYPVSATEVFFAGGGRSNPGSLGHYATFTFDTSGALLGDGRQPYGGNADLWSGTPIMYKPGQVLVTGGVETLDADYTLDHVLATAHSQTIDITRTFIGASWTYKADMGNARIDHDAAVLPDGRVLIAGGTKYHGRCGQNPHLSWCRELPDNWVETAEIWDPITNTWASAAPINPLGGLVFRGYHSTICLLPDGRVFLGGGDVDWPNESQAPSGEIYLPNYGTGARPTIVSGPDEIAIGSTQNHITVGQADSGVTSACLIALTAVTHNVDMNQRYIPFTVSGAGSDKTFSGPVSNVQAPYGWYMLFVLKPDGNGHMLPCQMAKYVRVVPAS